MTKDEVLAKAFEQLPDAQTYYLETFTVIINNKPGIKPVHVNEHDFNTGNFNEDTPLSVSFKKHLYYPEHGLSCKTTWQVE
ncbi:hypothetical protein KXQ82_19515 [Mucilaginibacter sp. HMF5004]|uniref:hypothetical protein n=1 Tax=Mucilaginibacter rivuli TaxID=2857527 RepID=UPI001C5E64EA|nr:hypothetical protein [Mucilaginibacter rivuli]MBW4891922.1 hypothetical protein [Mucilaginibacter rivuli]